MLLNYRHFANRSGFSSETGGGVTGKVRVMGSTQVDTLRMDNLLANDLSAELIDLSHIERAKNGTWSG